MPFRELRISIIPPSVAFGLTRIMHLTTPAQSVSEDENPTYLAYASRLVLFDLGSGYNGDDGCSRIDRRAKAGGAPVGF